MTDPARFEPGDEIVVVDPPSKQEMPLAQALALDQPRKAPNGCAFSAWLWRQADRPDLIGQLAHVVVRDPTWRGADRKEEATGHLTRMGARQPTVAVMAAAWDEYQNGVTMSARRKKAKAKRAVQKAARRRNR